MVEAKILDPGFPLMLSVSEKKGGATCFILLATPEKNSRA